MRRLILGTAGHIDHGKTALVRALTGVDTDRLKEEKERGITIDLGFAELPLDDGVTYGVVDVPGHEAFVRNMLAGATGMDVVLLVVAADEGVMPQTREHLSIVRMLDVSSMVVALTKCDLVDDEWLELVRDDVRELLAGTRYVDAPLIPTSAVDGRGLEELRVALGEGGHAARARATDDLCRIPVDRVFTVRGTGTVVTGTVWSGLLRPRDRVRILPGGLEARVRGLQGHGRDVEEGRAGERVAVALTGSGVDHRSVVRGQTIVTGPGWRASSMITARVSVLADSPRSLRTRARVRVHLGTAEAMARVVLLDRQALDAGEEGWVQLRLEERLVARARDRFVLRSYSPVTTIAGGIVAEPSSRKRRRLGGAEAGAFSRVLDAEAGSALEAAVAIAGWEGVPRKELALRTGFSPGKIEKVLEGEFTGIRTAERVYSPATVAQAEADLLAAVSDHHVRRPLERGMPLELLRQRLPPWSGPDLADAVLGHLVARGALELRGERAASPGFKAELDAGQERAAGELLSLYRSADLAPPTVNELPTPLRDRPDLKNLLDYLVESGALTSLGDGLLVSTAALEEGRRRLQGALGGLSGLGPADFRDVFPLTRKHLLPLLGYFDAIGVTVRREEGRIVAEAPPQSP